MNEIKTSEDKSLYLRLGGYDNIATFSKDFHIRLKNNAQLARYWAYRGTDGLERELQLLIDYMCASAGGPLMYTGRDMLTSHIGMKITLSDWGIFMKILQESLDEFKIGEEEQKDVTQFITSLKSSIVED